MRAGRGPVAALFPKTVLFILDIKHNEKER